MSTIVVTGAAGYIGGQDCLQLTDAGYTVVGIDRRPCPTHLTDVIHTFINADIADESVLSAIVQCKPNAILHCAGTSLVGPSITNPSEYYNNNFI